ncbi:hypothetical protein BC834DRAFT_310942 [Gloeopeniophorella convolvens]|nr:hypothetical protein BC834DRAFT_310942 [Gloeopeniophorella convolvens]
MLAIVGGVKRLGHQSTKNCLCVRRAPRYRGLASFKGSSDTPTSTETGHHAHSHMLVSSLPNNAVHTTRPSNLVIPSSSTLSSTSPTTPPLTAHPPTSHASIPRATRRGCFGRETRSEHPGRRRPSLQRRIRSLHTTRRFLRHRGEQGCHYERKLKPPLLRESS